MLFNLVAKVLPGNLVKFVCPKHPLRDVMSLANMSNEIAWPQSPEDYRKKAECGIAEKALLAILLFPR